MDGKQLLELINLGGDALWHAANGAAEELTKDEPPGVPGTIDEFSVEFEYDDREYVIAVIRKSRKHAKTLRVTVPSMELVPPHRG